MCSPGRFALLTGRTPFRTGLHHLGAMRPEEITLAKALKTVGYHTAHFGKWHLGNKGTKTSPVRMGFDKAIWRLNYFDLGDSLDVGDTKETVPLEGDTSVATMRPELQKLGIADHTLVWFTSDNGGTTKDSQDPAGKGKTHVGVRTVSVLEWPARLTKPIRTSVPATHVDMYPTILDITGVTMPQQPVLDGISLVPLLDGKMTERSKPLGFLLWNGKQQEFSGINFVNDTQAVFIDGKYKLIVPPQRGDDTKTVQTIRLHDIFADPAEKTNLAADQPELVKRMRATLETWQLSVRDSYDGKDFAASPK